MRNFGEQTDRYVDTDSVRPGHYALFGSLAGMVVGAVSAMFVRLPDDDLGSGTTRMAATAVAGAVLGTVAGGLYGRSL